MTKTFIDTTYSPVSIVLSESKDPTAPLKFKAVVAEADFVNANGRRYPKAILEDAFNQVNSSLSKYPGNVDHPGYYSDDDSVSDMGISWTEPFEFEGNRVIGSGTVIQTAKGRDLEAVIKSGISVGFSTRTNADYEYMDEAGKRVQVIKKMTPPYVDAVTRPSVQHTGIISKESIKGDIDMDSTLEAIQGMYKDQITGINAQLLEAKQASAESAIKNAALTESLAKLDESFKASVKRAEALEAELSTFRSLNEAALLDAKLSELTLDHRFAKAIIAEAKLAGVTLESAAKLIPAMTRLVESQASGVTPRGKVDSTNEDTEKPKDKPTRLTEKDANIEQMAAGLIEMKAI